MSMMKVEVYAKDSYKQLKDSGLFVDYESGLYKVLSNVVSIDTTGRDFEIQLVDSILRFDKEKFYVILITDEEAGGSEGENENIKYKLFREIQHVNESIEIVSNVIRDTVDFIYDDEFEQKMSEHLLELTRLKHEKHTLEDVIQRHLTYDDKEV